jgi:predicted porin
LGKNWTFSATVGFTDYSFLETGTNGDMSQPTAYTGELSVSNKTTKNINQTLTLTQASSFGYTSNTITIDRVSYKADWLIQPKVDLILSAYWERGQDSGGLDPETYNKYDISPEVDWSYSKRTSFYAYYEFTDKLSNFSVRDYLRNRIVIGARYQF